MKIGELVRATGFDVKTIRYYERVELLPAPKRLANGLLDFVAKPARASAVSGARSRRSSTAYASVSSRFARWRGSFPPYVRSANFRAAGGNARSSTSLSQPRMPKGAYGI